MFESIITNFTDFVPLKLIISTFLSSSILPIPSETLLVMVGISGVNALEAAVWGGIGSTLGSVIAYWLGKTYGRKLVEKIGKYFFLTEKGITAINKWSEKFGSTTVFISRIIPIVPHKIFSIIAGISSIDFKNFVLYTFIGSVPRCFLLVYFGNFIQTFNNIWFIIVSVVIVFIFPVIFSRLTEFIKS